MKNENTETKKTKTRYISKKRKN